MGKVFLAILIGPAIVVYLVSSFLIASFNIAFWQDGHRFLAVLVYVFIVLKLIGASDPEAPSKTNTQKDTTTSAEKESEVEVEAESATL